MALTIEPSPDYTPEQQAENRAKWVEALRSGDYPQAKGALWNEKGFCCLGVACAVAVDEGVIDAPTTSPGRQRPAVFDGEALALGATVQAWLGLADNEGELVWGTHEAESLIVANDVIGLTFDEIADLIESGKVVVQS